MKFVMKKNLFTQLSQLVIWIFLFISQPLIAQQKIYLSPEEASNSLYEAVAGKDKQAISLILGAKNIHLLPIDDIHIKDWDKFVTGWKLSHQIIELNENEVYIGVGKEGWIFPIPLIKAETGWFFDTVAGAEIIRIRRIGYNELTAMQFALAYFAAQIEYTTEDRNRNGTLEYAQKFISSKGKKDGLYWDAGQGEKQSPLGLFIFPNDPEMGFQGYKYKILKAQGSDAIPGAFNYLKGEKMTSGFALIAWPVDYANSGINSLLSIIRVSCSRKILDLIQQALHPIRKYLTQMKVGGFQ